MTWTHLLWFIFAASKTQSIWDINSLVNKKEVNARIRLWHKKFTTSYWYSGILCFLSFPLPQSIHSCSLSLQTHSLLLIYLSLLYYVLTIDFMEWYKSIPNHLITVREITLDEGWKYKRNWTFPELIIPI